MSRNFAGGTDRILFGAANGMTVGCFAFWFKTTQATVNAVPVTCWSGSSRTGLGFLLNNTANKLTVQCYNATGTPAFNQAGSPTVNDGAWHHAAFNFNIANGATQTLYIDGASAASAANSAAWSFASTSLCFGDPLDAFWATYNGDLAELGLWTARNLSVDEIAALAKGFSPSRMGPQGYWPLVRDQYNRFDPFISSTVGTTVSDHPRIMGGLT